MGSRLKENPDRTFYWFFEAGCPVARDKDPGLLFQFPEDFSDEESRETLPRFCFPYDIHRSQDSVPVQHFTFVLTDLEGCQRFGFCRLANSSQTCLCMLSYLPWFEVFYKLLNNLADYLTKGQINEMKALLTSLYKQPLPLAAGSVTLQMGEQPISSTDVCRPIGHTEGREGIPYFVGPDPRSLPSIPESRNLTELVVAVDVVNLLCLYASMLFERRILIIASKLSTLTACVHALSAVIYPMFWQHIFIPVLPPHLLDYCCAPMPFLIGVHSSLAERVRSRGLEEVVILNVDTNTLETPFNDLKSLPSHVMTALKVSLKRQAASPGCGVARAFLKAQALLFGGYRGALQEHEDGTLGFCQDVFVDHRSASMRLFLQAAVHLQFFKQFIDSRLELLNKGDEPDDLFEEEIVQFGTAGHHKSYQQLVGNLKKGGDALIHNMKSKANITTKGFTKRGLRNLLLPKNQHDGHVLQRGGSVSHRRVQSDCLQSRLPITQHFGKSRPRRPAHRHRTPGEEDNTEDNAWDGPEAYPHLNKAEEEEEEEEEEEGGASLFCGPGGMDLLGEIFDTLSSQSLADRGLLYGTRSLDLFGPDCHDYLTQRVPATPSQESLSLSISGSGSLHSWNLEEGLPAREVESDLTEDSDWLSLDQSVPEEEESESLSLGGERGGLEEHRAEQDEEVEREATGSQSGVTGEGGGSRGRPNREEVKSEGETAEEGQVEHRDDEGSAEDKTDAEDRGVEKRGLTWTGQEQGEDRQEQAGGGDMAEALSGDVLSRRSPPADGHPNGLGVTVQRRVTSPGAEGLTAAPLCEEKGDAGKVAEVRKPSYTPKVMSAVARFKSQAPRLDLYANYQTRRSTASDRPDSASQTWKVLQSGSPKNSSLEPTLEPTLEPALVSPSEASNQDPPPVIRVSELKKRFEA